MTNINSREIALDILTEILEQGQYSHLVINQALAKYQYLEKADRSLISRIVTGTVEYLIQIDYVINQYSKTKVNKLKPFIRTLLRMSVYQILYMDRIPDSAVCNEAVKLAVKRRFHGLKGFVNGVLRTISREKEQLSWPDLSIRYAMPKWLIEIWKKDYDEPTIEQMLQAFLMKKRMSVRCNTSRASREQIIASLTGQQVEVQPCGLVQEVLFLDKVDYLESLEAFQKGWIQVQDLSSVLAGVLAAPKEGDYIIDVCSAPGGKSLHMADQLQGTGHVDARDLTEFKVALIEENINRSEFTNISAKVQDALELDEAALEKADIVLADLPCSGLGIIGRKPDIKLNASAERLAELCQLQREILTVVQNYVKPGGLLVYSTCTINPAENQENAKWFAAQFAFEPVNIEGRLGTEVKTSSMKEGWLQLIPGTGDWDGFFISVFRKKV